MMSYLTLMGLPRTLLGPEIHTLDQCTIQWTRPVGQDQLDQTSWTRPVGPDQLDQTIWSHDHQSADGTCRRKGRRPELKTKSLEVPTKADPNGFS